VILAYVIAAFTNLRGEKIMNRREFVHLTAFAAVAGSTPLTALAGEARQLPARPIPGTDEMMPIIGLGNSSSFRADDLSVASDLLDIFLDHGGRYVDVGGPSAYSVGKLGREKKASDKLFLGNYVDPKGGSTMREEVAAIGTAQGKSMLDLVHTRNLREFRAQHDHYRTLKDEGLVRFIGIARSGEQHHDAIGKLIEDGLVDFIQTNYSMLEPAAADRLLPLAEDNGVAVNINRPFINGDYFAVVRGQELPDWAAEFDCGSWAQFSLKFILAHPAVNCVLTETANPKHAVDNLGAGFGRLPDADMQQRMLEHLRRVAS
jgi:diketogulonate reductase-like aldo/keto reductase